MKGKPQLARSLRRVPTAAPGSLEAQPLMLCGLFCGVWVGAESQQLKSMWMTCVSRSRSFEASAPGPGSPDGMRLLWLIPAGVPGLGGVELLQPRLGLLQLPAAPPAPDDHRHVDVLAAGSARRHHPPPCKPSPRPP